MISAQFKSILTSFLLLVAVSISSGYNYGEHKEIGEVAFNRFYEWLVKNHFGNQNDADAFLQDWLKMEIHPETEYYIFPELSQGSNYITYGVLNALSADHEENPLYLEEMLYYRNSLTHQVVSLHNEYLKKFKTTAPNVTIAAHDIRYAIFAAIDLSHFHAYGVPFHKQIEQFDVENVREMIHPDKLEQVFSRMSKTNSIDKYITLHTAAIYLAELAGSLFYNDPGSSKTYLYYAFLFNAFADHFLQDNFSAGHFVVNRSMFNSIINNQALHDFYNKQGLDVINLKRDSWRQYGDDHFDKRFSKWKAFNTLTDLYYPYYSKESERIIDATTISLKEILEGFARSRENQDFEFIIDRIPDEVSELPAFFIDTYAVLSVIPVPYNSELARYDFSGSDLADFENKNQLLKNRNFVRNRIANSVVLGIGNSLGEKDTWRLETRLNTGAFYQAYKYNERGTKRGVADHWVGITMSYAHDFTGGEQAMDFNSLHAGLGYNLDWWVSDRKFIGLFSYLEPGVQWAGRGARLAFSPSVGVQFGPLIGVRYYNLPAGWRLPLQYLLPLKFRYTADFVSGRRNEQYLFVELDILF